MEHSRCDELEERSEVLRLRRWGGRLVGAGLDLWRRAGGMLLGWIAGTLAVTDPAAAPYVPAAESCRYLAGGLGALLVLLIGAALARRSPSTQA